MLTPIWSLFLGTILHLYGNAVMMGAEADSHILPAISQHQYIKQCLRIETLQ